MYFGSWPPAAARKKYRFVTNKSKDFHKKRTPNTQNFRACGALKKSVLLFSKGISELKARRRRAKN